MPTPATPPTDTALDHALALITCGLRPVPIRPGGKHPPMSSWQHAAPTAETARNWWNGLYRDCGVGLVMGPQTERYLIALDIDTHDPAADGWEALHDLETEHGPIPDTWRSLTGSGGAHLLFSVPAGIVVRNQQAGGNRIAPGIDVRGDGGQIVVAPSIHPKTGQAYHWEYAPWDVPLAECPTWLLELVRERQTLDIPTSYSKPTSNQVVSSTPADLLRERWDWRHELAAVGWTLAKDGRDSLWTRPGKNPRDGHSAVLHGNDVLVVFTTEIPGAWRSAGVRTVDGAGYSLSPFAFYAATRHHGSLSDAGTALRADSAPNTLNVAPAGTQPQDDEDPDAPLRSMLIDWPEFWAQDHGDAEWLAEPVIAAKRSTALFAPGGTGKSLLALWLSASLAAGIDPFSGRKQPPIDVLYLDYEMTADDLAERLEQMGFGSDCDLSRLHYALLPSLPGLDQPEGGKAVVRLAEITAAELVVIDTFGRAVHGDENEADTVRAWYRWTGLHLKHAGRAFLRVDHAGKDLTKGQRGTSAKNDDVDVVWQMMLQEDRTFKLVAKKRRMGWVPQIVKLTMVDEDRLHFGLLEGDTYPAGTREVAQQLDELGVPIGESYRKASKALQEAGRGARSAVVRAALKYRNARSTTFHFVGDRPTTESAESASRQFGTHLDEPNRDALRDAPPGKDENTQVTPGGTHFGTHRDAPAAASGGVRRSIERTHPADPKQQPVDNPDPSDTTDPGPLF